MTNSVTETNRSGLLIAGEGLDGSGKTTVMNLVLNDLLSRGRRASITNWNEAKEIDELTQRLTARGQVDARTRIVLGAAELAARLHYEVRPALALGEVVIANKYRLSALAHALARGCRRDWVELVYEFAPPSDITVYFDVEPEIALERKLIAGGLRFWETGIEQSLGLPVDEAMARFARGLIAESALADSFVRFQAALRDIHHRELHGRPNVVWVDAGRDLDVVFAEASIAIGASIDRGRAT